MDVISLSIDVDSEKFDSRYRFAIAVMQRAKQLNDGAVPTKKSKAKKITTLAIEEVLEGTVNVLFGEEAVRARKEAERKACDKVMDEAAQKQTHVEDMSELEEDLRGFLKEKRKTKEEAFPWEGY